MIPYGFSNTLLVILPSALLFVFIPLIHFPFPFHPPNDFYRAILLFIACLPTTFPFYCCDFCSYPSLCSHNWRLETQNLSSEWTGGVFLLGLGLLQYDLSLSHPFICEVHDFTFLWSWIVFHRVYIPPFPFCSLCMKGIRLFPSPSYCELSKVNLAGQGS